MLSPTWIAKVANALHLLAQIWLHGQGLEDGPLQLLVLEVRGEGHVLEGQHQQVASLVSHGQGAPAVGESEIIPNIKKNYKIKGKILLEGGVKDVGIDHGGGHRLHGAVP